LATFAYASEGIHYATVRLKRANPAEYLGLVWPRPWFAVPGIIGCAVIVGVTAALLFVTGRATVPGGALYQCRRGRLAWSLLLSWGQ